MEINKIYQNDNLKLLNKLPNEYIDLIYCDILYGTGNNFNNYKDLSYDKKIIKEFYIPRFKQMFRVLKNSGSIYLQMDWRISHWIRCLMDNIFGHERIINEIIWSYGLGGSSSKQFSKKHDNILWYSKSKNFVYNKQEEPCTSLMCEGQMKNRIDVWNDIPSLNNMAKERVGYSTQKPEALLKRIILASSNENDLVADFFCGSGTSMIVAKKLNRNYIGCDISKRAVEITNERLK